MKTEATYAANFRTVNRIAPDRAIVAEGHYEERPGGWYLVAWRIDSLLDGEWTRGDWYRVHANRRKDLGALKLLRSTAPELAPHPIDEPGGFPAWARKGDGSIRVTKSPRPDTGSKLAGMVSVVSLPEAVDACLKFSDLKDGKVIREALLDGHPIYTHFNIYHIGA